jgi:hemerythrin superfamily protein
MDAINLLKNDHHKVDEIFQQFKQGGTPAQFQRLFDQLRQELTVHTQVEEQIFYPAVAQYPELAGLASEARQEHAQVKDALGQIATLDNTTAEWSNQMTQLMHDVQSHVAMEENEMFPKFSQHMDEQHLQDLGRQLEQAKSEQSNMYSGQPASFFENQPGQSQYQ